MIITFDGESGAGKTTIAREVAKRLGIPHIASGVLFRLFAWIYSTPSGKADYKFFVEIDDEQWGKRASKLANDPFLYAVMNDFVLNVISSLGIKDFVIDGRSVGKSLFPNADYKFFVEASLEVRAQRRMDAYPSLTLEGAKRQIEERDERDRKRIHFPLRKEHDTVVIDNSQDSVESAVGEVLKAIKPKQHIGAIEACNRISSYLHSLKQSLQVGKKSS